MEAVGEYAAPYLPGLLWHGSNEEPVGPSYAHVVAPRYFNTRKTTIYGGKQRDPEGHHQQDGAGAVMADTPPLSSRAQRGTFRASDQGSPASLGMTALPYFQ